MTVADLRKWADRDNNKYLLSLIDKVIASEAVKLSDFEDKFWESIIFDPNAGRKGGGSSPMVCKCVTLSEDNELSGIAVNEQLARQTPCHNAKGKLAFSRGIVGALSEEDKQKYCKDD